MAREPNKQTVDRLLELLYRELSSSPRKLRRVTTAAGVNRNYPVERRAAGTMDLAKLCALVEANGEDFASFVARALAPEGGSDLLERPEGEEPAILEMARRRAGEETRGSIPRSHLEALDDLRYDDPAKAREGVEAAISFIEPADVPFALGVYASCCRPLMQYQASWHALITGLDLVRHETESWTRANLLQRAAFLHYDYCRYPRALETSERATLQFARLGDFDSLAQTFIDQGMILYKMERLESALSSFRSGLQLLPTSAHRHLCAGYHALALHCYYQGEHELALEHLDDLVPPATSMLEQGKYEWLRGCCFAGLDRRSEAVEALSRAYRLLDGTSPPDAALVVCDQVRHHLLWGQLTEALEGAQTMRTLLFHEENPALAAAARDLALIEMESGAQLTVALVDRIKEQIVEARRAKPESSNHRA